LNSILKIIFEFYLFKDNVYFFEELFSYIIEVIIISFKLTDNRMIQ